MYTIVLRPKGYQGTDRDETKNYSLDSVQPNDIDDYLAGPDGIVWDDYDVDKWDVIDIIDEPIMTEMLATMIPIVKNISHGDADLFQEGILAIMTTTFPADIKSKQAWLITVAKNAMIDYLRKQSDSIQWDENEYPTIEEIGVSSETRENVARALAKEFNMEELALIGYRMKGLSDAEIAVQMQCSQQMISIRKRDIGKRIRKLLID